MLCQLRLLRVISAVESNLKKSVCFATLLICMIYIALLILCEAFLRIPSTEMNIVWLNGHYWKLEDAPETFVLPINVPLLRSNLILPDLVVKQLIWTASVGCMYVHFQKHYCPVGLGTGTGIPAVFPKRVVRVRVR